MATETTPPSKSRRAEGCGSTRPRGRAVGRSEDDQVGALGQGEVAQARGRRRAEHDVLRDVALLDRGGAGLEQRRDLLLGEPLTAALGLVRMAHVRQLQCSSAACEQPPERERVAVVVGAVVGDDDLDGHRIPLDLP